jgi:general secretion pathway protein L
MNYTGDQVRLEGTTSSFDAINRIASTLEGTPGVAATQISDAKMSMDGSQVDFRLTLTLSGAKEGP